jgi:hypothetical protein
MNRVLNRNAQFVLAALIALGIAMAIGPVYAQEKPPDEGAAQMSVWMKKKLDYSQGILEGLAVGDFDMIAKNAEAMRSLSKFEGFVRGRSPGYRTQLQIFDEANKEILVQARRDNLEGASLGFAQLTMSCVNCHKQLRQPPPPSR